MKQLLAVLFLFAYTANAQELAVSEPGPWHHDSQYVNSVAADEGTIVFSPAMQVPVQANKIYSHLEFKVQRYDHNILLTAQLIKYPEMDFVNTLVMDCYRYYKITFANGQVYTYNEPFNSAYTDKTVFMLLKGTVAAASASKKVKIKADERLYALMCRQPIKSIQPFVASYNPDTRKKGAYEAKEVYNLTDETANELMKELR